MHRLPQAMAMSLSENISGHIEDIAQWQSDINSAIDNLFLMVMGCIVFLMHFGFGFLEAGSVRYAFHIKLDKSEGYFYDFSWSN